MKVALLSVLLAIVASCAGPSRNPLCHCAVGEKFSGEECVAAAEFVAPTECVEDALAVCGCDEQGYTSKCAAFAAGIEVQYAGACRPPVTSSGGGFGW